MNKLKIIFGLLIAFAALNSNAQSYIMGTGVATNNATINGCTGTFYDSGGSGSDYSNNENLTLTFCSGDPGKCINLNFSAFDTKNSADNMQIFDGPSTASTSLGFAYGNLAAFSVTSSGTCLTVQFISDGSQIRPGWTAAISCITKRCPATTSIAPSTVQNICQGAPSNTLTATPTFSGTCGTSTLQYQWYYNTTNSNTITGATLISGATGATYSPPTATLGTLYYFCVAYATDNNCGQSNATQSLASNAVGVTVYVGPCPIDYLHPTSGINGSYSGSCPVATSSGMYYDNGGTSSNYTDDINAIYRTFCPQTAGNCVRLTFNSFNTSNANDYLRIQNGPAQNSSVIIQAPTDASGFLYGNLNASTPFVFDANNSSGCLTVRFTSNACCLNETGWAATITNFACAAALPINNSDCSAPILICNDSSFVSNSNGPGLLTSEGCGDCLSGESYSSWYQFTIASSGTLAMTIIPSAAADYDFLIKKGNCSGTTERCSFSGLTGNTGLASGNVDVSENASGNSFLAPMTVTTGEVYYLMVNSWTAGSPGFSINWILTDGASLDCTQLPIELVDFEASYLSEEDAVDIKWETASERNNSYFTIEKSIDGTNFDILGVVDGMGNTNETTQYIAYDPNISPGVTYYRLKQTDFDGASNYSDLRTINVLSDTDDQMAVYPNPTSGKTEIIFNSYKDELSTLILTDSRGLVIQTKTILTKRGGNYVELDLSDYSNGIYFITVTNSTKVYSSKVFKN